MKIEDTVTITQAAAIMAVSRQSVHNAIKAGKIKVMIEIAGRKLLRRADVEAYKARATTTTDGASGARRRPGREGGEEKS